MSQLIPLKWHKCGGWLPCIRRLQIVHTVVADVREKAAILTPYPPIHFVIDGEQMRF